MADSAANQPHGPSDNSNKTADALRDVPVAIQHQIHSPPSRNVVAVGLNDSFHSCDRASKQIQQNASPHQHRSTPKNANKTTDALRDEAASKIKEAVVVPNLPACPHSNTTSFTTRPASDNGNGAANQQETNVSLF